MAGFDGFVDDRITVGTATLRVRYGGAGPPILLLHGHPRTHATWHRVAPLLVAAGHAVVCPDLRGYGRSSKPPTTADHAPYSKRAMAADCRALMEALGYPQFAVIGHDRGAYVASRLALDSPQSVRHLGVLDAIPIGETLARCNARFAATWWHWFFFAQPDTPERVINADPDAWYHARESAAAMGDEAFADYHRAIHDPATVHAMLEDYRAGLGIDCAHDDADRAAGTQISCPVLVLWASRDDLCQLFGDPLEIWRSWAADVRGGPLESGHHMAEEVPDQLARAILMLTARR